MGYYPPESNEVWLSMYCPVQINKCGNSDPSDKWLHAYNDCGGRMKIGTHMKIICSECNYGSYYSGWWFACKEHGFSPMKSSFDMYSSISRSINLYYTSSDKLSIVRQIARKM